MAKLQFWLKQESGGTEQKQQRGTLFWDCTRYQKQRRELRIEEEKKESHKKERKKQHIEVA